MSPVKIFFSPVTILAGLFDMINFGWGVVQNTVLPLYLQKPAVAGGYGFTPQQNAFFQFDLWLATILGQVFNYALNDRIPLRIAAKRADGVWKPEYRLYTIWFPAIITMPIGLGLFGASLQYHLHYMVIALGAFLVNFSAVAAVPAPLNYLVETFQQNPQEVGTALNFWRLILGLTTPFFITQWQERVGVGWVFGMAAFFSIFGFSLILLLMWKGPMIRQMSLQLQRK